MSDLAQKPQPDDDLWEHLRQRLADEGIPPERAEALAAALLDPESRPGALDELEGRLDRLTDVLERLPADVEHATDVIETAGRPAAATPVAVPPDLAPRSGHENVRHPIRAVEREAEHLHEVADKGESPATPAILIGGVASVAAVLIAVMIALAFGVAYFVTRGDDPSWWTSWKCERSFPGCSVDRDDRAREEKTTTAGNLVFVGRNNGELQALDARTGKQLWSFQTGAGGNNTATVFEHNGRQYVAFYPGGSALGASANDVAAYATAKIANKK